MRVCMSVQRTSTLIRNTVWRLEHNVHQLQRCQLLYMWWRVHSHAHNSPLHPVYIFLHIPTYSYIFPHMPHPNRPNYFPCIPNVDWLINILAGGGLSCQIFAIRHTTRAVHSNSVFHVWTTSAKTSHTFHKYRRCIYKFKSNFSRSFNITEHLDTIYNGLLIVYLVDIWCWEGVIEWGRRWTVILNSINKNRNNRDHSHSNMDRIRVRRTTPKSESNDQRCMWMKDIECIEKPTWKYFYRLHSYFGGAFPDDTLARMNDDDCWRHFISHVNITVSHAEN